MNDLKFTTAGEYMSSPKVYEENIDYEYNLSNKSIKLLEDNTYPKLDRFLNQILR